jgi:hypothetical protein
MRTPVKSTWSQLASIRALALCAGLLCGGTANAEVIIEWVSGSWKTALGGTAITRNTVEISGPKEKVEANYSELRNAIGHDGGIGRITARDLALRCASSDGLGWHGALRSHRKRDSDYKFDNGQFAKRDEAGTAIVVCGAATLQDAVHLLVSECSRQAQCTSETQFVLGASFDGHFHGLSGGYFTCGTRADEDSSFSSLSATCRSSLGPRVSNAASLARELLVEQKARPSSKTRWAVIPGGPKPAITDVGEKPNGPGDGAVAHGGSTTRGTQPERDSGATTTAASAGQTTVELRNPVDGQDDPHDLRFVNRVIRPGCAVREFKVSGPRPGVRSGRRWSGECARGYIMGAGTLSYTFTLRKPGASDKVMEYEVQGTWVDGALEGVAHTTVMEDGQRRILPPNQWSGGILVRLDNTDLSTCIVIRKPGDPDSRMQYPLGSVVRFEKRSDAFKCNRQGQWESTHELPAVILREPSVLFNVKSG